MAARLDDTYRAIEEQKDRLEVEVKARTAALEREHKNLATIIGSTADGILSVDRDGVIELANAAAERQFGSQVGRLAGRRLADLWPGWSEFCRQASRSNVMPRVFEIAQGERRLSLSVAGIEPEGALEGFIVVVRDVSEERRLVEHRRELDRQMFQMEKMTTLGELAMGLAHEIGNPLAGMKAVVQMLAEEEDLKPHHREWVERISNEVNRLSGFLRTFHGFSAPQESHPAAVRLEQALEDVLLWTRKEATSRGVTITFEPCRGPVPELWADPNQLKQVLLNLVINAILAMPKGGKVEIGMCFGGVHPEDFRATVPRMRFCVRDTGQGISPDVLPKIFDPFFTTRPEGSGLGLAVVKKIATQHGADILVESTVGHGTCFELIWPVAVPAHQEWPERMPDAAAGTCRRGDFNA
jgi:PAS domain S-box-containing protein